MKPTYLVLFIFTMLAMPAHATWTPFRDVTHIQTNTSGDFIFWLSGHTNDEANPGRCDLSVFKYRKADAGYAEMKSQLNDAFYNNKKVRVYVTNTCHNTGRYKRITSIQVKR